MNDNETTAWVPNRAGMYNVVEVLAAMSKTLVRSPSDGDYRISEKSDLNGVVKLTGDFCVRIPRT